MLVEISNEDYLPAGKYRLDNGDKLERAKSALPDGADERSILIEYDKLGGAVSEYERGETMPVHTFWNVEKRKQSEAVDHLSDKELLAIIREGKNAEIPTSRCYRAKKEWELRHQQKIQEAAVQKGVEQKKVWWKRPEIVIPIIIALFSIPWLPNILKKDKWLAIYYPNPSDLTLNVNGPIFDTLDQCRDWVDAEAIRREQEIGEYDYECGLNCKLNHNYGLFVCDKTLQ